MGKKIHSTSSGPLSSKNFHNNFFLLNCTFLHILAYYAHLGTYYWRTKFAPGLLIYHDAFQRNQTSKYVVGDFSWFKMTERYLSTKFKESVHYASTPTLFYDSKFYHHNTVVNILKLNYWWQIAHPKFEFCVMEVPWRNGFNVSRTSLFFKFLPYFLILQSGVCWRCCDTLKNHQIWDFFLQNMKKSFVQLALNPFFGWFLVPDPSLVYNDKKKLLKKSD